MKKPFKLLFSILFVLLLCVKASAFHVYTHEHDDDDHHTEHCGDCDLAMEIQQAQALTGSTAFVAKGVMIAETIALPLPTPSVLPKDTLRCNLFCRPPPHNG